MAEPLTAEQRAERRRKRAAQRRSWRQRQRAKRRERSGAPTPPAAEHGPGRPKVRQGSQLRQSGWLSMPTRKPAASRLRARIAIAKLG